MNKFLLFLCLISTAAHADNYAIVEPSGNVANVIEYDGKSAYNPPAGDVLIKDPNDPAKVAKGWTYIDGEFSPPAQLQTPVDQPTE